MRGETSYLKALFNKKRSETDLQQCKMEFIYTQNYWFCYQKLRAQELDYCKPKLMFPNS